MGITFSLEELRRIAGDEKTGFTKGVGEGVGEGKESASARAMALEKKVRVRVRVRGRVIYKKIVSQSSRMNTRRS